MNNNPYNEITIKVGKQPTKMKTFITLSPITMKKFTKTERHELLYKTKNTKVYSYESLSWEVIAEVTVDNDWYEIDYNTDIC